VWPSVLGFKKISQYCPKIAQNGALRNINFLRKKFGGKLCEYFVSIFVKIYPVLRRFMSDSFENNSAQIIGRFSEVNGCAQR
jgi:hypothetical protein